MGILKKIAALALAVNLGIFTYLAWPMGYSTSELAASGMPVVARAAQSVVTPGEIYRLDRDRPIVQTLIRLDIQLYSQHIGHIVMARPDWKTYVITGDLAQKLSSEFGVYAFTNPLRRVIIFFAVPGADPMTIIAHEYTHVLQTEDSMRLLSIPKINAEYEAEILSRTVVGFLSDLSLPKTYPIHKISKVEKLQVRKYLAVVERE